MKNRNLNSGDDWATPKFFYDYLNNIYNFDFDPCPFKHDLSKWNGLMVEWGGVNFVNPPYSRGIKDAFVKKGIEESKKGKICLFLIPVSTSTVLFHDFILPNANKIIFIKGRIPFDGINTFGERVTTKCGMHDSMLIEFNLCNKHNLITERLNIKEIKNENKRTC